jgi:hypothetical protein
VGVSRLAPAVARPTASWRREPLAGGSTLFEHVDLAAWFDAPFVPFARHVPPDERAQPDVIAAGRRELAPTLYAAGALNCAGPATVALLKLRRRERRPVLTSDTA